jgi:hypothetical protein
MGTFAETAIVDYHLSFADQGKQTSVYCFCLRQTNGKAIAVFSLRNSGNMETLKHGDIDMETWKHGEMETWRHGEMETSNRLSGLAHL